MTASPLEPGVLPGGVLSRFVEGVNGLRMHLLEAGEPASPCVVLLHGFPELAYSWRKILPRLAEAGFHAVAPDLRGYGRTATRVTGFNEDLAPYRMTNRLLDLLSLVSALGRQEVALVGHDYGSWVAGYAALARPDVFTSVTLMSAPFTGAPPLAGLSASPVPPAEDPIHAALAALPRPRKHYQAYFATQAAASDMDGPERTVAAFLRAYFHHKSADWSGNAPHPLPGWTAEALAGMPTYYVMDRDRTMPDTVAPEMPADGGARCPWLTPDELSVFAGEYARTGFQGAPARLPGPDGRRPGTRARPPCRPARLGAGAIHRRPAGLGALPGTGGAGAHADGNLPAHGRLPPPGRGWSLGAAGTGGASCRTARRVPAPARNRVLTARRQAVSRLPARPW